MYKTAVKQHCMGVICNIFFMEYLECHIDIMMMLHMYVLLSSFSVKSKCTNEAKENDTMLDGYTLLIDIVPNFSTTGNQVYNQTQPPQIKLPN